MKGTQLLRLVAPLVGLLLCACAPSDSSSGSGVRTSVLTYYVNASTGNDSNDGTSQTTPWLTIAKVNSYTFNPGETVLFAQGQKWREQLQVGSSGTAALPLVFGSYGSGAQPIISGSDLVTAWTLCAACGSSTSIYSADLSTWSDVPGVTLQDGDPLSLVNWAGTIAATAPSLSAGTFSVDFNNKIVYVRTTDGKSPTTHTMEIARRLYSALLTQKNYVTMQGLTFEQAALHCIFVDGSTSVRVTGSTIRNCGGTYLPNSGQLAGNGIEWATATTSSSLENSTVDGALDSCASPQLYDDNVTLSNTSITGNTMSRCGKNGVEISILGPSAGQQNSNAFITGVVIQSNTITDTGKGWSGNRGGSAIASENNDGSVTSAITGVSIVQNTLQANAGDGVELRSYSGITTIQQNRISANDGDGVALIDALTPTSTGLNLYTNLIYDNVKHGLEHNAPASQPFKLYNNVFYDNGSDAATTFNLTLTNVGNASTSQMFNNICYAVDSLCLYDPNSVVHGASFDNDIFYRASGVIALVASGATYSVGQLAQFQTDTNSHASGYFADPMFTSTSAPDFHLKTDSVGLSAGRNVSLTEDFAGDPIPSTGIDIGAYQH